MQMLTQILTHTPRWVFVLFALLVWLGMRQMFASAMSLTRVTLMPLAMTGLSFYGIVSAFGDAPVALIGWAGAATAALLTVQRWPLPASARYDVAARRFHLPGSAVPLALMMGIFFTKYTVGVLVAMHPQLPLHTGFALGIGLLYGAFSGVFAARALRLWKLAIREDRAGFPAAQA
ncbi:DUF6622 family protein [Variovorax sp. KK3]|uniref:DUF6622 family protein n=1 Tax=Variovorax sp. KK3 TaxID=1855728 RepID=UPI002741FA81|nr:DUF6622 family protein [Variovorax sp. KK3]